MEFSNPSFQQTPLTALSSSTVKKLSSLLNNLKIIHSQEGYERDWRGLAILSEQRNLYQESNTAHKDPLKRVIDQWCECNPTKATFGNLLNYLGKIDRWHVIEDMAEDFLNDLQNYQSLKHQPTPFPNKIVRSPVDVTNEKETLTNFIKRPTATAATLTYKTNCKLLTTRDVQCQQQGLPLETYHAFLLYAAADYHYAWEILLKLQNSFKICLKDDLLFGITFEHVALMELIRERCTFLIAILTKEFTKSCENRFFVNYAQTLQIKHEIRKMIPLMYEEQVEIPPHLAMFSCMRYNPNRCDLYWSKLALSMQLMPSSETETMLPATLQGTAMNSRLGMRNLAIEANKDYVKHKNVDTITSSRHKNVARKEKCLAKRNRGTCKKTSLESLEEKKAVSLASSSCSLMESRGLLKQLFCCH